MNPGQTVSVLMIAYNKEAYIDDAIKGVVKQTKALRRLGFGLELVIMDDCSTDSTPDIITHYYKLYPDTIKSVRNSRNLGLAGNYIAGFVHCQGKYLAICDADDYWFYGSKLACQVNYMEKHPECAITFHRMINLYDNTGEMSLSNGGTPILTDIEDFCRSNYITNSSVVYRRELVDLTSLPNWMNDVHAPDLALHMFYASKGNLRFFRRPMGVYRKASAGNWSAADPLKGFQMSLEVRRHLLEWLGDTNPTVISGILETCRRLERDIESVQNGTYEPPKKRLASRLRSAISRLLPVPRP